MIKQILKALGIGQAEASFKITQNVKATVFDKEGNILRVYQSENRTCKVGRNELLDRMGDFSTSGTDRKGVIRYMAAGSSATAPTDADTALNLEVARAVIIGEEAVRTDDTLKVYARFEVGGAYTMAEMGLLTGNAASSTPGTGTLFAHTLFSPAIAKTSDEAVLIEWTLTTADA